MRILIANRGEIACRIIRSCRRRDLEVVAVHSQADAGAMHVEMADAAVEIGAGPAAESYLVADRIIEAAKRTGAGAIHPGYGFLSENESFAKAVIQAGLVWIGPRPETIAFMGDKDRARDLARKAGVPLAAGSRRFPQGQLDGLRESGTATGFPLLVKAANGGGGIGMRRVDDIEALEATARATQDLAQRAFGDGTVYLERFIPDARHIEVQIFGFGDGNAVHVYERDCSIQRRFQKIIEESRAPAVPDERLQAMFEAAVALARQERYAGAGTIEFIYDDSKGDFYFLEMNTRIQVEHPVTEMRTGLDLVGMQIDLALGMGLDVKGQGDIAASGHAIECRLYAERPEKGFLPSPGQLERFRLPPAAADLRIETGLREGDRVQHFYDPLIAKLVASGGDRDQAIERMRRALADTDVVGVQTNLAFLERILDHAAFREGRIHTRFIDTHHGELLRPAA